MKDNICVAIITKPHGLKGEVKVKVLLNKPNDIKKLGSLCIEKEQEYRKVESVKAVSDVFAIKLENINTCEQAAVIKNRKLFAKREDVDKLKSKDDIFIDDIIGLEAVTTDGESLGTISTVENFGASDVVFIKSSKYKNLSFANIGGIILSVDENKVLLNSPKLKEVMVFDEAVRG